MARCHPLLVIVVLCLLAGCTARSISDSGYPEPYRYGRQSSNPYYKGELSEFDVLGIEPSINASEEAIQQALKTAAPMTLVKGESLLVIQSGALLPDEPMIRALERYFTVAQFSGIPQAQTEEGKGRNSYSSSLRLAAARAGHKKIFVYWGMLETAQRNLATKTVSWIPVVGGLLPDETQEMRIRLKVAVVDVLTGSWAMYAPHGFDDKAVSAKLNREASDQEQVAVLKEQAYTTAVDDLIQRYVK